MAALECEVQERGNLRAYADYSLERKAEVLAVVQSNNGNVLQTSRDTGIPHQTISFWLNNSQRFTNVRERKQVELADLAETNAYLLGNSVASHDLDSASLSQKATAFGIMVDKMQLLRGQPTSITAELKGEDLAQILQGALNAGAIDVTPEPLDRLTDGTV